jgi:APA family basic amino acid/polyamine antiporter
MVPVAGSAYTYAYASLGEFVAWIIGWDLIIEYAVGNIAVAISWAGHFRELLSHLGLSLPAWLAIDYRTASQAAAAVAGGASDPATTFLASALTDAPRILGAPLIINIPAVAIVALITIVLVYGIRESATTNTLMVLVKVGIVLFFIAVGAFFVRPENYTVHGGFAPNGFAGITSAAAIIFFAYIGFDAVSTAAEETKNPAKDMPFGIIASLAITTVLYILVALVMTGMAPWCSRWPRCCWCSSSASRASSSRWRGTACCRAGRPRCTRVSGRPTSRPFSPGCSSPSSRRSRTSTRSSS